MKKSAQFTLWLLAFIYACGLFGPEAFARTENDNKEIMRQAQQAYYSLSRFGLIEFQSTIQPNWQLVLQSEKADNPSGAQEALKMLNGLHFSVSLDSQGNVKVNHTANVAIPSEKSAALNQISSGIEQAVSGFFMTWNLFMLNSPFPEVNSEYQLQDVGGQYLLLYKEGTVDVSITMTKEFAITEIKVSSPEFKSSIKPHLIRTPKGYVLTGYEGNYEPVAGKGKAQLKVELDYQEVKGLQLPHKLHFDSVYDETPSQMDILFSDCQVKTR